jgi:hypothetical protein
LLGLLPFGQKGGRFSFQQGEIMSAKDSSTSTWDVVPATISSGTALSSMIDLKGLRLFAVGMPSSWTTANLTFQVSPDGGTTWFELYDQNGNEITATAAASNGIVLSPSQFSAFEYLRIRSGTAALPVNQMANATLQLILRAV